jgi:hypothetical protein
MDSEKDELRTMLFGTGVCLEEDTEVVKELMRYKSYFILFWIFLGVPLFTALLTFVFV